MTREDLLKGNAEIAAQFGKDVRQYCPNVKHIVVIFNPADITGLITLLYSGLKPSQVSTLAALDSTRLQNELVKYFHIPASDIQNCRTYGGHGEQMAVFASTTKVKGEPLTDFIGTTRLPLTEWEALKVRVIQGGKHIIDLRGRSSFQSPAYLSIEMIAAAMGGQPFRWPAGTSIINIINTGTRRYFSVRVPVFFFYYYLSAINPTLLSTPHTLPLLHNSHYAK